MFDIFGGKDPQKALKRAQEYIKEERLNAAIRVLEDNLTNTEESFDCYLELARLYFETERRDRTAEILHRIQSIAPQRTNEIIGLLSEMFYRHTSIDLGDLLLQLFVQQQKYEELSKVLRAFGQRELKLLQMKYEKASQTSLQKNVLSKKDIGGIFILVTIEFFINEGESAVKTIEPIISIDAYMPQVLSLARIISRERYNNPDAAILYLQAQLHNQKYADALLQAQRIYGHFPDSLDKLIEIITSIKPPKEFEAGFSGLLTEIYIKKGDLDASINTLCHTLKKDPATADKVIKGLRELARIHPGELKVLYALGDTYLTANRISLAIGEFNKIIETDINQFPDVLSRYKKAFEKEPNNPEVLQGLVNLYLKNGDFNNAVEVIETAYKKDPGLLDEYILDLNQILEKNIGHPKGLYLLGLAYARKGDQKKAAVIFGNLLENGEYKYVQSATQELLKLKPDNLLYLNLEAQSLVMLGESKKALSLIAPYFEKKEEGLLMLVPVLDAIANKAPKLFPQIEPFYRVLKDEDPFIAELTRARAYAFIGNYEASSNLFEQCLANFEEKSATKRALIEVLRERPEAVPLLISAARIFMKEGELEIATKFFKTAQRVDPKAFFEIVDEFYDTLKTFPKDREVRTLLIDTFFHRKLWERVIEETQRAIEVFGRDAQYFNLMLGKALVENGNLSGAVRPLMLSLEGSNDYAGEVIEYLDKILEIDKSNVSAHFARGRALSRAKRVDEAVEEFLLTVRIVPARAEYILEEMKLLSKMAMAHPKIFFALGNIEIHLNKIEDAVIHLVQACELDGSLVKRVMPIFEKLITQSPSPLLSFSLAKIYHLAGLKSSAVKYFMEAQSGDKNLLEPAITELKRICLESPRDVGPRKRLAEIYLDYNNLEDALEMVNDVYRLNAKEVNWTMNYAKRILEKNSKHIPSYYFLGKAFLDNGNYKKAIEVYKKLTEISPSETAKLIEILDKDKEKNPELLLYVADLYKVVGNLTKATALYDKLFSIDKGFGEAINYRLKEILTKNADLGNAYLLGSEIFTFQKEYDRAIEAAERAKKLMPKIFQKIILKEGQIYFEKGEAEKAIELYSQLLGKTKSRKEIYRLIRKTKEEYFTSQINSFKGDDDNSRLQRARLYLLIDKISHAEKELDFIPKNNNSMKYRSELKAKIYLKKSRPLDALELMRNLPVDEETAPIYADIYEALGSYQAAASILRLSKVTGAERRIATCERLAQSKRLQKGKYFIEGRT